MTEKTGHQEAELPKAVLKRLIKSKLQEYDKSRGGDGTRDFQINKEALLAFSEASKLFIHYLTSMANDICKDAKRQTVNAEDVLKALTDMEFEEFVDPLKEALEVFKTETREKNKQKAEASKKRKAEAAEAEAQAQLQLAEVTFRRFEELNQRGSVSLQEFDQAKANYDVAQARRKRTEEARSSLEARKKQIIANLEEAKTFYNYTRIKAPFAGLITQKIVAEGDLASPGSPLLVIEDNHHYQLEVFIDESQVSKIKTGEIIEVEIDASGEGKIKGKVSEIIPQVDPVTRTFLVKVDLPLLPSIKSGMFGKAYFPVGKRTCILVPREALLECGQLSSLFIVNPQGQVERRLVKSGKEYDGKVEILSGLDIGETIVVRDIFKVKEGCRVGKKS